MTKTGRADIDILHGPIGRGLFRLAVPDVEAAETLGEVRRSSPIPIVADVHFDYRCALAALAAGAPWQPSAGPAP